MKMRRAAALCLAAALVCAVPALTGAAADDPFPPDADDYISMTAEIEDGSDIRLHQPVYYTREGEPNSMTVRVAVHEGSGLAWEVAEGDIALEGRAYRRDLGYKNDYYVLTITPRDPAALLEEDFRVELRSAGLTAQLRGRTAPERARPLLSGMRYKIERDGTLFSVRDGIDEEARVEFPRGLTVVFKGDYGEDDVNLAASARPREDADGRLTWTFARNPSFAAPVTVRIRAPEGASVNECLPGGGKRAVETKYRDGCVTFKTDALTGFELVLP